MYISYANLWKLLAEKELTKSDLMTLTGLSSRVIAKLAKNETVTTDTIAKICAALSCDVGEVMACEDEASLSLYACSRAFGKTVEQTDELQKIAFTHRGRRYLLWLTRKPANRATRIECAADGTILREQHHMMGGLSTPAVVRQVLCRPKREGDETVIVVIKGKPGIIIGLDEGIWVSAKKGSLSGADDIFVMSEAAFKLFSPT